MKQSIAIKIVVIELRARWCRSHHHCYMLQDRVTRYIVLVGNPTRNAHKTQQRRRQRRLRRRHKRNLNNEIYSRKLYLFNCTSARELCAHMVAMRSWSSWLWMAGVEETRFVCGAELNLFRWVYHSHSLCWFVFVWLFIFGRKTPLYMRGLWCDDRWCSDAPPTTSYIHRDKCSQCDTDCMSIFNYSIMLYNDNKPNNNTPAFTPNKHLHNHSTSRYTWRFHIWSQIIFFTPFLCTHIYTHSNTPLAVQTESAPYIPNYI